MDASLTAKTLKMANLWWKTVRIISKYQKDQKPQIARNMRSFSRAFEEEIKLMELDLFSISERIIRRANLEVAREVAA